MREDLVLEVHLVRELTGGTNLRLFAREENGQLVLLTSDYTARSRTLLQAWTTLGRAAIREAVRLGLYKELRGR